MPYNKLPSGGTFFGICFEKELDLEEKSGNVKADGIEISNTEQNLSENPAKARNVLKYEGGRDEAETPLVSPAA